MVHVPRHRLPPIGAAVAGGLLIIAIVVGVASRTRKPPPESVAAKPPAAPAGARAVANLRRLSAVVPRRRSLTRAAAAAIPDTGADGAGHAGPARARERGRRRAQGARADAVARRRRRQGARLRGAAPKRTRRRRRERGSAGITVGTYPWSQLWIDGADTGQHTPVVDLPIACGTHKLEFKRRDLKISQIENVTLNEGREFKRQYELKGTDVDE